MTFEEWKKTDDGRYSCDETRPHLSSVECAFLSGYRHAGYDGGDDNRYGFDAAHRPVLRASVEFNEIDSVSLTDWYEKEEQRLHNGKWKEWNPGMMALRTICVQIDAYSARAFKREADLFDFYNTTY
jgi:hypothetical protein